MRSRTGFSLSIGAVILAAGLAEAGKKVPLKDVPEPAVKLIKERFPKAEISSVDKESNGDYEFTIKEGERKLDVGVSAVGKLLNVKEDIEEAKLPAKVKEGIQKKFPGATIVEAEKVVTGDGKDAKTVYELVIKTEQGKKDVEFDGDGKQIEEK